MKTLLFASAFLLSAAAADGSTGGLSQVDSHPDLSNLDAAPAADTLAAAADMVAEGSPVAIPEPVVGLDLAELDEDFQRRQAAELAEFDRIRALIPVQEFEVRPCPGASHLGLVIGTPDGIRCVSLADWRTDRICLKAGDHVQILVLAGEGLRTWHFYREQEERDKARPPFTGEVTTASISPMGVGAPAVAPVLDPMAETLPAGKDAPTV